MPRRDWRDAIAAHEGWPCRVCCTWPRELAHVLPREYDARRGAVLYVDPKAVVPLCGEHHVSYDRHELNLLPFLLDPEIDHAIQRVGEGRAMRRIQGRGASL